MRLFPQEPARNGSIASSWSHWRWPWATSLLTSSCSIRLVTRRLPRQRGNRAGPKRRKSQKTRARQCWRCCRFPLLRILKTANSSPPVQTAGNRIRINAQLIDAKTDEHLWAETYDRILSPESIFDVQDDIARAIAEALQITLAGSNEDSLIPTTSMAAYRAYHEAINIRDASHGGITSDEYRRLLRKSFELDPSFTRPRSLLVGSYALAAFGSNDPELIAKAEAILEDIRAIAPNSADFLIAQTYYTYYILKDYDLALQIAEQALKLAPSDTNLVQVISRPRQRAWRDNSTLQTRT